MNEFKWAMNIYAIGLLLVSQVEFFTSGAAPGIIFHSSIRIFEVQYNSVGLDAHWIAHNNHEPCVPASLSHRSAVSLMPGPALEK